MVVPMLLLLLLLLLLIIIIIIIIIACQWICNMQVGKCNWVQLIAIYRWCRFQMVSVNHKGSGRLVYVGWDEVFSKKKWDVDEWTAIANDVVLIQKGNTNKAQNYCSALPPPWSLNDGVMHQQFKKQKNTHFRHGLVAMVLVVVRQVWELVTGFIFFLFLIHICKRTDNIKW